MRTDLMFSSERMDWSTPQDFFEALDKEFGFTLDPCASDDNHKCDKYYTMEQDGLKHDWSGETAFVNPPYGRQTALWVKKCFEEVYARGARCVVMLLPARTDTRWFHRYIYHRAEVRFVKGRLKFGGQEQPAPFPSMVVVFRNPEVPS